METCLSAVVEDREAVGGVAELVLRTAIREARRWRLALEAAEDVGQTVVLRYLPRATEIHDPVAWSRFVARNLALWHGELAKRSIAWSDDLGGAARPWIELETRWRLEAALSVISERDRRLLTEALEGASHARIAQERGVGERDVGTMLRRAAGRAAAALAALETWPLNALAAAG